MISPSVRFTILIILIAGFTLVESQDRTGYRTMKYSVRSKELAVAWQETVRTKLKSILKLQPANAAVALDAKIVFEKRLEAYTIRDVEISTALGRRIKIRTTTPASPGKYPAVVCIPGHNFNQIEVYYRSPFAGFPPSLARNGFVTASVKVSQHKVQAMQHTLMGERLLDLIRTVDYLHRMKEVDSSRIGAAGLSLGGEMAMFLGALDTRIAAVASSGFLTTMEHLQSSDHCPCWKETGLQELVDLADIYSLIAPRPLLIQIGEKEQPSGFPIQLAKPAFQEISLIYNDLGYAGQATLDVHTGGHVISLPGMMNFFTTHFQTSQSSTVVRQ